MRDRILSYLSADEQAAVARIADRVRLQASTDRLPDFKVMVAFGGGKDSAYVVAFVRAVQLHLARHTGSTFTLRVANMRHAGVPHAVMVNIDRTYRALGLLDDPRAELLTVDHAEVRPFHRDLPFPAEVRAMNRFDVLMNGHRTAGDGRPTFCNSCNLAVADFYGRVAWWGGGVDAIVTGDSRREQRHYSAWIMRLAARAGIDVGESRKLGFQGLLQVLSRLGDSYYRELFGEGMAAEIAARRVSAGDRSIEPEFVSIYEDVSYRADAHWDLLVDLLSFEFDELAFSFSESDCANPTLMAHLRGLKAEQVDGRRYEDGIGEYLELAEQLMHRKEMPERLIQLALGRYSSAAAIAHRRRLAADYARDAFALDEPALVAMVFAPFVDGGGRLAAFVDRCHPDRSPSVPALHDVLAGTAHDEDLVAWLEQVSALPVGALRHLYAERLVDFRGSETLVAAVRAGDPHKGPVTTVDPVTGRTKIEVISGR